MHTYASGKVRIWDGIIYNVIILTLACLGLGKDHGAWYRLIKMVGLLLTGHPANLQTSVIHAYSYLYLTSRQYLLM